MSDHYQKNCDKPGCYINTWIDQKYCKKHSLKRKVKK